MADNFFDKYELYTEGDSLYCYAGTSVLKNKLDLRDADTFRKAEAEISFAGLLELELNPLKGKFDQAHLFAIHKFLFDEIYDFAGKMRQEDISKGKTKFCVWAYIDDQLDELFAKVQKIPLPKNREETADFLSYLMAELNIIHPFREGNGRAIREFIREYALNFGYRIDWSRVEKTVLLDAMIESVYDKAALTNCLLLCMTSCS